MLPGYLNEDYEVTDLTETLWTTNLIILQSCHVRFLAYFITARHKILRFCHLAGAAFSSSHIFSFCFRVLCACVWGCACVCVEQQWRNGGGGRVEITPLNLLCCLQSVEGFYGNSQLWKPCIQVQIKWWCFGLSLPTEWILPFFSELAWCMSSGDMNWIMQKF